MSEQSPHPVDIHVGGRVRARRRFMHQSQTALSEAIGVTFQQVQKYERGYNRISTSKLFEIATAQGAPVSYYFEGLDATEVAGGPPDPMSRFAALPYAAELAEAFVDMSADQRRAIINVVRALKELGATATLPPIAAVDHGAAQPFN